MVKRALFLCCLVAMPGLVLAGPNEGGVLLVHANPQLTYTSDHTDYCGQAGLAACSLAVTSVPWDPETTTVFYVLAAFPEGSQPRLKAVSWGVEWDASKLVIAAHGSCADFDVPDGTWPASGTGIGQSFTETKTVPLTELYWFAGYAYGAGEDTTSFRAVPHPAQGAVMVDDAVPPNEDEIAALGRVGFGTGGVLPCPEGGEPGGDSSGDEEASLPNATGLSFVEMATTTNGEYVGGYRGLERDYGLDVAVGLAPDGLFCRLDGTQRAALNRDPRVVVATDQSIGGLMPNLQPGQPGFSALVWNELLTSSEPDLDKSGEGGPIDPPLLPDSIEVAPDRDPEAQTSVYMLGEVGVSLLFVESADDSPCDRANGVYTENWNEADPNEITRAHREAVLALEALEEQGPGDGLEFHILDEETRVTDPGDEEPIRAETAFWMVHALNDLDSTLSGDGVTAMTREWNNRRRKETGYDWWFTVFVARSVCDPDSSFPGGAYGYSHWYGPFATVCYPPRTRTMGYCLAHEVCHVFGAADEYGGDSSGVSCDVAYGYLRWGNHNSLGRPGDQWCHEHVDCLMNADWGCWTLCEHSRRQIGWWDRDGDGVFDPLDHPDSGTSALIGGVEDDSILLGDQVDITNNGGMFFKRLVASHWGMDEGYVMWDGINWRGGAQSAGPWRWSRNGGSSHPVTLATDSTPASIVDLRVDPDSTNPSGDILSLRFEDSDTRAGRIRVVVSPQFGDPRWVFKDELQLHTPPGVPPVTRSFQMPAGCGHLDTLRVLIWDVGDTDGGNLASDTLVFTPVSAVPHPRLLVPELRLSRGRPNPSARWVTWEVHRVAEGRLDLAVVGVDGRRVRTWPGRQVFAGVTRILWDGRDDRGQPVSSGRYFLVCSDQAGRAISRDATIVR